MYITFYELHVDVSQYQWIMPKVNEDILLDYLNFDCKKHIQWDKTIKWYPFNPKLNKGNFFSLGGVGAFAFDEQVYQSELFEYIEMSGEILEINLNGDKCYILNVLECVNSLNQEESIWNVYPNGNKGNIKKFAFDPFIVSESSIFKIPETSKTQILYYQLDNELDSFKSFYDKLGFQGLIFKELYKTKWFFH